MSILNQSQITKGYYADIGGFPEADMRDERKNFAREVSDYKGQDKLCISCTQLDYLGYSERDKKRILTEWVEFLRENTKTFKALHFNLYVARSLPPQIHLARDSEKTPVGDELLPIP